MVRRETDVAVCDFLILTTLYDVMEVSGDLTC